MQITAHAGGAGPWPSNSAQAFLAADALQVDRIEFDVMEYQDQLMVAHDPHAASKPGCLTLAQALEVLAPLSPALTCDIKTFGREAEIHQALKDAGILEGTIFCGHSLQSLAAFRSFKEDLLLGWSVPQPDGTPGQIVPWPPELAIEEGWHDRLITEAPDILAAYKLNGLMCQHSLISQELVDALHGNSFFIHAWTVDDTHEAKSLTAMGVDGVTSNHPKETLQALG